MTKHFILKLDPTARYDWDRCTVRDPITADRPDFADLIAAAVGHESGSYLISVNIEVQVLEQVPVHAIRPKSLDESERTALPQLVQFQERVA